MSDPFTVPRIDPDERLDFEGAAIGDRSQWQVIPYSTSEGYCVQEDADSVMPRLYFVGEYPPAQAPLTPVEARRMAAALLALAEVVEKNQLRRSL